MSKKIDKELEKEIDNYFLNYKDPYTGKPLVKEECWLDNDQAYKFAQHIAQWQKEQMKKGAVDAVVVKPDYQARGVTKSIRLQIDDDAIACAYDKGENVKVLIIRE